MQRDIRLLSRRDALIILLLAVIAVTAMLTAHTHAGAAAQISKDGKVIAEITLSAEDREFTLPETGTTVFEISGGRIRIKESDCPEHTCVRRGFIGMKNETIICLPKKIIITVTDGAEGYDAVVG